MTNLHWALLGLAGVGVYFLFRNKTPMSAPLTTVDTIPFSPVTKRPKYPTPPPQYQNLPVTASQRAKPDYEYQDALTKHGGWDELGPPTSKYWRNSELDGPPTSKYPGDVLCGGTRTSGSQC